LLLGLLALPIVGLWLALHPPPDAQRRYDTLGIPYGWDSWSSALDAGTLELLASTLVLAASVSIGAGLLGGGLAWAEHRLKTPGGAILAVLALLPLATPSYLVAASVQRAFGPAGLLGRALGATTEPRGLLVATVVLTVVCTPYVHLLIGAALARSSAAEEEAARMLGAGPWRRFRQLALPELRPTLAFALLIVALYTISDFGAVSVLHAPVLTWRIYQAQSNLQITHAVWAGFGILILVVPLLFLARAVHGEATSSAGRTVANPRPAGRQSLGPLGLMAVWALHVPVIGLGVLLPVVELLSWLQEGEATADLSGPLLGTAVLATVGATVTLALAFATGWVAARRRGAVASSLDHGVFLVSAMPGILVAFGLGLAAVWLPEHLGLPPVRDGLRQAGVLVVLGYATRYLAEGHGGFKAAVLRLDPRLEESARALGAGPGRRLTKISLPLLAPAAVAGFLLLFLALIKELPVTLMVAPLGVRTLAYRVWERYTEGFLPDAAAAGLTLLTLALAAQLLTLKWRRHA
jgi:iron(III) transport system permease protein